MTQLLWQPTDRQINAAQITQFMQLANKTHQLQLANYQQLHQWSITYKEDCWKLIAEFCQLQFEQAPNTIYTPGERFETGHWFNGATLNFAANLLARNDNQPAILYADEDGRRVILTFKELNQQAHSLAAYLQDCGVEIGDRVAGFLPNCPATIIGMLATTLIGAIWTACSPDFGLQGLLDRFSQVEPKVLIAVDSHSYNGKRHQHLTKIAELQHQLPSLQKTIILPNQNQEPNLNKLKNATLWDEAIQTTNTVQPAILPFDHPIYILYSSGTTGKPKCMVHGAGNTLLQHKKELMLHTDLKPDERIFYYTTCGWMMWNWLISSLAVGATVVLYDGAPFYSRKKQIFDLIDELQINVCGVGAKYIEACAKFDLKPNETHALTSLRTILSTGSPLLPDSFDYVYQNIKQAICLSSISGGSDIVSCFALGNPALPVFRGELQCLGLGMDVKVFNTNGKPIVDEKGELVCTTPFPSMPIYFWNDSDGTRYHAAYFERFANTWTHGDYASLTQHGSIIIYGRSDATLNPSGVRVGTAEIYQQVEKVADVLDCLAVGQEWKNSERIILFVMLKPGITLNKELQREIKNIIRTHTSPHHVPAKIIQVPDLPRTMSGKLVELAVKNIIHNQPVTNTSALANPETLEYFKDLSEIQRT